MAQKIGYGGISITDLTDDPQRQHFWFLSQPYNDYDLTTDTEVVSGKTYYKLENNEYVVVENPTGNPQQQGWYEFSHTISAGAYVLPESSDDFKENPDNIPNLFLNSGNVRIRNGLNTLMELSGNELNFYTGEFESGEPISAASLGANGLSIVKGDTGGWAIDVDSIHSIGKEKWDSDIDGIFIGNRVIDNNNIMYTISGGKRKGFVKSEDADRDPGVVYYQVGYVVTTDILIDSDKTYYIFEDPNYREVVPNDYYVITADTTVQQGKIYYEKDGNIFQEVENPTGNPHDQGWYEFNGNPSSRGWYEKAYTAIPTSSGWIATEDTKVQQNKAYYRKNENTYIKIENPTGDPHDNGWYESFVPSTGNYYISLGPIWYINSDGTVSFGSLTINEQGVLEVPAASITGVLDASQIRVGDLGAISANIGSTIDSETTTNTLKVNSKIVYELSLDTQINSEKTYYYNINGNFVEIEDKKGFELDPSFENASSIIEKISFYNGEFEPFSEIELRNIYTSSLVNTTWTFNDTLVRGELTPEERIHWSIDFISNEENYTGLYVFTYSSDTYTVSQMSYMSPFISPYTSSGWNDTAYKTIKITGGEDATNTELINWLQLNASLIEGEILTLSEKKLFYDNTEVYNTNVGWIDQKNTFFLTSGYSDASNDFKNWLASNSTELSWYEKIEKSFINLKTEKNVYEITSDSSPVSGKNYYIYQTNYVLSNDTEIDEDKTYYIDNEGTYSPIINPTSDLSPLENNWYEKKGSYVLTPFDPQSSELFYEITNTYSAEVNLEDGNIIFSSNDKDVLSVKSEEENDLNVSDIEILEKIKLGDLEIIPFNGGMAVRVGGED